MPSSAPTTVLVVEDDEDLRAMLVDLLHGEGYQVRAAGDGLTAVRLLDEALQQAPAPCSLLLLDMMLPRLTGLEVLHHVRELPSRPPVVAMSASRRHLAEAHAAGATATLPKPFELDALLALVQQHCPPAA